METQNTPKPNEKLNKKLDKLGLNDTDLALRLGYRSSSTILKKRKGLRPWTAKDGFALESISKGAIKKEEADPAFFKKHKITAEPEV